jgi:hypothetical protein
MSEDDLAKNNVWHAAKLRGVAFRAIGQEPGWLLEIKNGEEILIVTDYGQNKKSHPYVEPQEDKAGRKTVFQVDADTSVLIEGKACSDTMREVSDLGDGENSREDAERLRAGVVLNGFGSVVIPSNLVSSPRKRGSCDCLAV